ncbi:MAG: CDP-diacylglycerol--serine O-phosphatidyltransferase [Spongiibacter sp.]|uniref:CDP-diacylglycerol--serine O-phosphatidyltransferase n=1 Tax=Spongiibacter thalassae TaxID=2721624 RepID=A0ABX1GK90_9GAMM|nr:CDP-diacylglycerol--serine O-phosphatidyltransferase [Spongiibacter thalassae]MDX1506061.1 CDP-diacylglycerol--serine O-phosphatidyltransferase [Spongiibacter sp.]NKI19380.1 CDP-diacylglycerol--serine O-phosphatidyltransferase [Spongiibacter thalassae]
MADDQNTDKPKSQFEAEALLLVDDHEEEVSINGKTVRKRGVYLLPNLFTTAALFSGFFAIVSGMNGRYEAAAMAIFASMVFDGLDGRVARLMNAQSKFGAEYDSLADMVSFGVAPALVIFTWGVGDLGKFGWMVTFIYIACAALRLARFNTQIDTADKNYFTGLASPAAAAVIAGVVWVASEERWVGEQMPTELAVFAGVLIAIVGMLMILNVPYHSFKGIDLRGRVPFVVIILIVLGFGVVALDPARILLAVAMLYAVSGPVQHFYKRFRASSEQK